MTDLLAPLDAHPEADRIRARVVKDARASLIVEAGGLSGEARDALEKSLREAALAIDGIDEVQVALTAPRVQRKMVAIGSGKGGVGKSTLSANLAVALAKKGVRVGLIDADIYGPSQPRLLDAQRKPEAREKQLIPVTTRDGVKLLSVGQLVEADKALAWRGPMATGALTQLIEADWGDTELILVDLPPGTGDVQLTLVQKAKPQGALVVSTPQDLALIDATRAIDLFEKTGVPVLGVVENMAGYTCPHCGKDSDPFGQGGAEASAKRLRVPFLGRLPLSKSLREASDAGRPPAGGDGPAADAFATLADALVSQLETIAH
ncbi:Mrp/NBP35 family ATP-binding protein [Sphingomicrobium nitratireducens]|uniref:Mrp/NBP35 family ATP-binding protein n=1 Tax=Sphingomicrobium nitratireducens TaxID=2964666 RepID=UPI00223F108C|nr:Mrp/NBP35 family ATP-binding protein [Sphingomicrobium nitratireducens]